MNELPQPADRSPEDQLYWHLHQVYGGMDHTDGLDGHSGPWRTCGRCHELVTDVYFEAIKRGGGTVSGARAWVDVAPAVRMKTLISDGKRTARPHQDLLARPERAAGNVAYTAALQRARRAGRLTCRVEVATQVLAAILVQVHHRGAIPGGEVADWRKVADYVDDHLTGSCPLLTEQEARRLWHDEIEVELRADPRALRSLDDHLYRPLGQVGAHPGPTDGGAGAAIWATETAAGGALSWSVSRQVLVRWTDDEKVRLAQAQEEVLAGVTEIAGPSGDVPAEVVQDAAAAAVDDARKDIERCTWLAAVPLALGPPVPPDKLVGVTTLSLVAALCKHFELNAGALDLARRSASWTVWLDSTIVQACELKADVRTVRGELRRSGSVPFDRGIVAERLAATLAQRHGWSASETAFHRAQTWFAAIVDIAAKRPLRGFDPS